MNILDRGENGRLDRIWGGRGCTILTGGGRVGGRGLGLLDFDYGLLGLSESQR
jgi:hypothetical protein